MSGHNQQGKKNGNYIDGRTLIKHFCIICKTNKISLNNFRTGKQQCQKCYFKTLKGEGNPHYIRGNTHNNKCIECGKIISKYSIRCMKCAGKITTKRQQGKNNPMYGKIPTHGKRIKYKKIKMRSTWEVAYAKWLDKQGIEWQYEPNAFDLGKTTYTPDFYLPKTDEWIEIKGYWRDDAKKKFEIFKKKYNSMNIKLLMKKDLEKLGIL